MKNKPFLIMFFSTLIVFGTLIVFLLSFNSRPNEYLRSPTPTNAKVFLLPTLNPTVTVNLTPTLTKTPTLTPTALPTFHPSCTPKVIPGQFVMVHEVWTWGWKLVWIDEYVFKHCE